MRARLAAILSLVLVLAAFSAPLANARPVTLAQEGDTTEEGGVGEEDETQQGEGGNVGEGEGQSDPEAETGAGEGETEEGASAEEEGPPWTYQMARIGLVLLLVVGVLMGLLYYRMIASRQRAA